MHEKDNAKTAHSKKMKKEHKYNLSEMESRRSETAYKRFMRKPYYLEDVKNGRTTGD